MKLSRGQLVKGAAQQWPSRQISHRQFYSNPVITIGKKIWDLHQCIAHSKRSNTWLQLSCDICIELREFHELHGFCELLLVAMILSSCLPCMKTRINPPVLDKGRQQRFGRRSLPSSLPLIVDRGSPGRATLDSALQLQHLSSFDLFYHFLDPNSFGLTDYSNCLTLVYNAHVVFSSRVQL